MPGALETLIEGLSKYSWRTFTGIFAASSVLLLFPERLGLKDWVAANRAYLVIALLVSGAILLTHLGTAIHARITERRESRIDLRMVPGDPLHAHWTVAQAPDKKPMMILVCSMNFAHSENISVILKRGYLQGTREVFAMNPIVVEGSQDGRESICMCVTPVRANPGKELKARLVFVDQFNHRHRSEKIAFRPNTMPDDFIKTKILSAFPNCAFCGQPITFEEQAKEAQTTAHTNCIWKN